MKAVIMCGGSGTRLWPISRKSNPKQFVPLFNGKSLFELTLERNLNLVDEFIIVVNELQLPLCRQQIPKIISDKVKFIIEPIGRNTAPAITLAALLAKDADLLILASDHLIKDQASYENCVANAQKLAKSENLVTFGITPEYPEIGYGYIQADKNDVISFKEKPNLETAKKYIESGNYYWNSGMFFFNSSTYLNELKNYQEEIFTMSNKALTNAKVDENVYYILEEDMLNIPQDSIDYAVMEKSKFVKVVPSAFNWSDLGSFDALYEELPKDTSGNTQSEMHLSDNSHNNIILSDKRIIATFDINDLIIVDTEDALLIGKRGESQKVKQLLSQVKKIKPELLN
jgi:mannose-1-phosphate guanylyltransferase